MTHPHYEHSPLIEALCEFRFEPMGVWDQTIPGLFYDQMEEILPVKLNLTHLNMGITVSPESVEQQFGATPLSRFSNGENTQIAQVGQNLLSTHHLQPYSSWKKFRPFIERCLTAYQAVAHPAAVERVTLRYINRIEIATTLEQLAAYFAFYPHLILSPVMPHNFIIGTQQAFANERDTLTLQMSGRTSESGMEVFLDLVYILTKPLAVGLEDVSVWLEEAHAHIQTAFEASLQDAMRQHFGEVKA